MDEFGVPRFDATGNTFRRKRTPTCRRPKPEEALPENHVSLSSTPPSDDAGKISSDENGVDANPKRKVYNLNQGTRTEGEPSKRVRKENGRYSNASYSNGSSADVNEDAKSGVNNGGGSESKIKKVKLKVGGVTRTIQPKSNNATVASDTSRSRPKLILQDNSDEDDSPALGKKIGLQGIPWKDFSRSGISLGRENASMGKNSGGRQGEKSDRVRKSKRVPKKRVLDGEFDEEDDDEIRYLEKLKTVKVAATRDFDDDSGKKHRSLSKVSRDDSGSKRSGRDSVSADTDYEEENMVSDNEIEGNIGKKPRKESPDSPNETKKGTALTSRQRSLLSGKDSGSATSQIEFPNGLPPAPPRKQKEKLTEVEQQLKKAEAAERRRMQNEKAARESEAEAIRKILGQDSTRKKREDKLKKRQEELAQEKAANAKTIAPNTIRTIFSPTGTTVAFAEDIGLPHIFDPKPTCYPPPREKCAGPSCTNSYRYRDSKSNVPLCSLQCYKAIREGMQAEIGC
ncbi:HIT zinc finger, PAPA-1-like conserved region [Artemisia annua]|uniref:HIT zinc finger, PAPA-1-like conserved region n=1 Tax=Artemisia annua TaxID=35608 RepID=A0A2U1PED6_ARTAN|nr:HIT zinc finger, PAPA-1-like conserved region [Artemisia annua]